MKTLWIAAVIFALVVAGSILCAWYVHDSCGKLIEAVESLPDKAGEEDFVDIFAELSKIWQRSRFMIRNTVGHTEADTIEDTLKELETRDQAADDSGYQSAVGKLKVAIEKIRAQEEVTLDAVL